MRLTEIVHMHKDRAYNTMTRDVHIEASDFHMTHAMMLETAKSKLLKLQARIQAQPTDDELVDQEGAVVGPLPQHCSVGEPEPVSYDMPSPATTNSSATTTSAAVSPDLSRTTDSAAALVRPVLV